MLLRSVVIIAAAAVPAMGQADPIARAALEKAAQTIKNLDGLSYQLKFSCEGLLVSQTAESTVTMLRDRGEGGGKWRVKWVGSYKVGSEEPTPIHLAFNPATSFYTWQDDLRKKWGRRPEFQAPKPMLEGKNNAWVEDISKAEPLADMINAPEITPEGDQDVGGVLCDVILVRPEKGSPKRWALAKEDHLPRRVEWLLEGGGIKGSFVYELSNVVTNPPLTPEDVDIAYPEGYVKDEAPPPPPPTPAGEDGAAATGDRGGSTTTSTPAAPAKVVGAAVGNIAPEFELTRADTDGKGESKVALSVLRGKPVVLEFGGSWNARSRAGHPELKALAERFKDRAAFATVSVREKDPAKPTEYMKQNSFPWSLLLAGDEAAKLYKVRVYPTYFVISPEGEIAFVGVDYEKEKTMPKIGELLEILAAPSAAAPGTGGDGR